jgi:hypothetical protein
VRFDPFAVRGWRTAKHCSPVVLRAWFNHVHYISDIFLASKISGASQLARHLKVCEVKGSMHGAIQQIRTFSEIYPTWELDQEVERSELIKLIFLHELTFSFVEYAGFRMFVHHSIHGSSQSTETLSKMIAWIH